jgi:RNA polymerase-binding transcription factor DksA
MQEIKRTMRRAVLSKLFEHLREHYNIDWMPDDPPDDPGNDRYDAHQIDAALAFRSDTVLNELRSALFRLEQGSFGVCINCKRPISEDILHVDPTQRFCQECEHSFSHVESSGSELRLHVSQ